MRAVVVAFSVLSLFLASCTTLAPTRPVERYQSSSWEGKEISELVAVLGPFETSLIQRGIKSYNWFRFGNCRLTARVSSDDRITEIETEGTVDGCHTYLERLRLQ
jgi:hypothetical protein